MSAAAEHATGEGTAHEEEVLDEVAEAFRALADLAEYVEDAQAPIVVELLVRMRRIERAAGWGRVRREERAGRKPLEVAGPAPSIEALHDASGMR